MNLRTRKGIHIDLRYITTLVIYREFCYEIKTQTFDSTTLLYNTKQD